jgi:hypothetical protein
MAGNTRGMEFPMKFTAQEARKLAEDAHSLDGDYKRAETIELLGYIKAAASKGQSTFATSITDKIVETRLNNLGFTTKVTHEQRDGDYMTISW